MVDMRWFLVFLFFSFSLFANSSDEYDIVKEAPEFDFFIEEESINPIEKICDEKYLEITKDFTIIEWEKLDEIEITGQIIYTESVEKFFLPYIVFNKIKYQILIPIDILTALNIKSNDKVVIFGKVIDRSGKKNPDDFFFEAHHISFTGKTVVIERNDFVGKELSKQRYNK